MAAWLPEWLPQEFAAWARSVSILGGLLFLAAIGGVVLFIKRGWPWLKNFAAALMQFVQIVDSVKDLPEFIKRTDDSFVAQDEKIAEIHHEVHYNNGISVKDAGRRTENAVGRVELGVRALVTEVETVKTELTLLRTADDEIRATVASRNQRIDALEESTQPLHPKE